MANKENEKITATIIEALSQGTVPWQKPWKSSKPCNAITGKSYRGINTILLGLSGGKYSDHRWVTYKQAQELGGNVKKGEKSTWIVFYSTVPKKIDGEVVGKFAMMKTYFVFNVEQCEGLTKLAPLEVQNLIDEPDVLAEKIWEAFTDKPKVNYGLSAFYSPLMDEITMPKRESFNGNPEFYSTLFHEGAHSTGHSSRLNRKGITDSNGFGSSEYGFEELVAELTASFLMAETGLGEPTRDNSVAYIKNWIQVLQNDTSMVVKAAAQAQKAFDYMTGVSQAKEADEDVTQAA